MANFKFEVGDRVVTTGADGSYLPAGMKGTIRNRGRIEIFSDNEYLFEPDEQHYSNVAGWILLEEDLEAEGGE